MKKLLTILLITCTSAAYGQDTTLRSLNDLYIPNSPGLILGDKSPSSVDKPTTPRAFAVSLINLAQGGALEVTPYWLKSKPNYTYTDWVKRKFTMLETFNISVASYKTNNTFTVAPGLRTQILRIFSKKSKDSLLKAEAELSFLLGAHVLDTAKINQKRDELRKIQVKGLFALEVAGAILGSSTDNSFKKMDLQKSGVWANVRWDPSDAPLSVVGLGRYSWAGSKLNNKSDSTFLDLGVSLSYVGRKIDLSAEYVSRKDYQANKRYGRVAVVLNYLLSENIILVASTGKNFSNVNDIIAVFGVKFGVSTQKAKL